LGVARPKRQVVAEELQNKTQAIRYYLSWRVVWVVVYIVCVKKNANTTYLHDEGRVFVGVLVECVQLSYRLIEGLN